MANTKMNRRTFLSQAAVTAAASTVFPRFSIGKSGPSPNSKVNAAFIGSGGWIAQQPNNQGCKEENLVAFCDVDRRHCAENMKNWRTSQAFFDDYRVMLDKMHKPSGTGCLYQRTDAKRLGVWRNALAKMEISYYGKCSTKRT